MRDDPYFVSCNDYKLEEYRRLFRSANASFKAFSYKIIEPQTSDYKAIALHKVLEAYQHIGHPVIVETCGVSIDSMSGFPSGLNSEFWRLLGNTVCEITSVLGNLASATTMLAYCDGRKVFFFEDTIRGSIASTLSQKGSFVVDRVFVPYGMSKSLSELSPAERDKYSYRAKPAHMLVAHLLSKRV